MEDQVNKWTVIKNLQDLQRLHTSNMGLIIKPFINKGKFRYKYKIVSKEEYHNLLRASSPILDEPEATVHRVFLNS